MGFIDGDHSFEGVFADLNAIYPKIKPGGVLLLHDVIANRVYNPAAEAIKEFCNVRGLYCEMMLQARRWPVCGNLDDARSTILETHPHSYLLLGESPRVFVCSKEIVDYSHYRSRHSRAQRTYSSLIEAADHT